MGPTTFDPDSSTNGTLAAGRGLPEIRVSDPGDRARAAADLLQGKLLSHTFGVQGEWEVRTTLVANRQAWRYRSSVLLSGKEIKKGFPPIEGDWTRQLRQAKAVTDELVTAFAREAAEVHFASCANVAEYSLMTSLYSQPLPRQHKMKKVALVLLSVAALLTAAWLWRSSNYIGLELWRSSNHVGPEQAHWQPPPHSVRWQPLQVSYRCPAGKPFVFPLPTLARTPEGMPVEVTLEASGDVPSWLQLDRERLQIGGTAPLTADDQTYQLTIRAHAEQGSDSRLLVLLTIIGQPNRVTPPSQLRSHWTW
jgi:Putative Ig domain